MKVTFDLLNWSSFPVIVLAVLAGIETVRLAVPRLGRSRGWQVLTWFWRPWAFWAVFNIVYRLFESRGFNNRLTFPFYFDLWEDDACWTVIFRHLVTSRDFWAWSAVLLLLGLLLVIVCRRIMAGEMSPGKTAATLALLVVFGFSLPLAYDCIPGGVGDPWSKTGSAGRMWVDSGNTMLYCLPFIQSKGHYLRHFEEIQPQLKVSIHGADHPPGASLALYWTGKLFNAKKRIHEDLWRYQLGTTLFAAMAVVAMFTLGWSLCGSTQVGLMSAALWAVKPTSLAYDTFAPDTVYWVFYIFCFALIWRVVMAEKRPYASMVGLGVVGTILALLNFNWPLQVGMFGLFLLAHALLTGRRPAEWLARALIPSAVMIVLFVWICVAYRLNYLAIFIYGLKHFGFYDLNTAYKWWMALIGGQLDVALMMGSFCAYVFWTRLPGWIRQRPIAPQVLYTLVILGLYLIAVLLLKDLKIEAGRIWAWTMAVPLVLVADHLRRSEHPRFYFLAAVTLAMVQYYGMRLLMVSAG